MRRRGSAFRTTPIPSRSVSVRPGEEPVHVQVTVDGEPIPADRRGGDVMVGPGGQTHFFVDQFRLYDILRNGSESVGELQFSVGAPGLALYAVSLT